MIGLFFFNVNKIGNYLEGSGPEIEENTYLINESFIKDTPYHFFSEDELRELLKDFRDIDLNYFIFTRNNMSKKLQNWIVIAKK